MPSGRHHHHSPISQLGQMLHADLTRGQFADLGVIALALAAFAASLTNMGGAAPVRAELPLRLIILAMIVHAILMHGRHREGKGRIMLAALAPAGALAAFLLDALIHPGTAWLARESAVTVACAASVFWLVAHHTRHVFHRWFAYASAVFIAAVFGILSFGNSGGSLAPSFANRSVSVAYEGHATGPFGTPGEFAALMAMSLMPALTALLTPTGRPLHRFVAFQPVFLIGYGLWAAGIPAAAAGVIVGAGVILSLSARSAILRGLFAIVTLAGVTTLIIRSDFEFGLFRDFPGAPKLPSVAMAALRENPLFGTGTGAFSACFEKWRPFGMTSDPSSAGGFFHSILAENGVVGLLLITVPFVPLILGCHRKIADIRPIITEYDRQFDKLTRRSPEPRVAMIAVCASCAAGITVLALDYPGANLSLALLFAIFAGTVMREVFGEKTTLHPPAFKKKPILRTAPYALPAALLFLFALPVVRGKTLTRVASDAWEKINPDVSPRDLSEPGVRLAVLDFTIKNAEKALRYTPDNADAQAVLASAIALKFNLDAVPAGLGRALAAARAAAAAMPGSPRHVLPFVESLRIHGDFNGAVAAVDGLHALAPTHPDALLEYVRAHLGDKRMRPDLLELLAKQAARMPGEPETARLIRAIRLADA